MATIRKRGKRYQVQIREDGFPQITKSFSDQKSAQSFAKDIEARMEKGLFMANTLAEETTLTEVLKLYSENILPQLKGRDQESYRIRLLSEALGASSKARTE